MAAPLAQCAPRLIGESNTGSWRTHTPFSTTASIAQPTEQWLHTVRRTSILPWPTAASRPSAARAFFTSASCVAAMPTPTPRPERRRKARRSIVGIACASPRCKPCTRGERDCACPDDFLVSNMSVSPREMEWRHLWRESDPGGLVVAQDVVRQLVAAAAFGRRSCIGDGSFLLDDARQHRGGCDERPGGT